MPLMNEVIGNYNKTLVRKTRIPSLAEPARARFAASLLFLVDGVGFGTWAALIPSFKHKFSLSDAGLSCALLGMVIGALISMPLVGRAISRWGSRALLCRLAPIFCLALCVLALAP